MTERAARRPDWLGIPEALERILAAVEPLSAERVPIDELLGRTLAEPIRSPIDQPPWDNSAMDGFAVRAADIAGASPESPVELLVIDDVPAGAFPSRTLDPGTAIRVMTGAPVPAGADSVVRLEHTDAWPTSSDRRGAETNGGARVQAGTPSGVPRRPGATGTRIGVRSDEDANRNIRLRGEDLREGTVVLEAGRVLRPAEIGVLATVGGRDAAVHRRPRVAILANGDELVDLDRLDEVRAGRRIVNSNTYALAAAVRATGGEPVSLGIAPDDAAALRTHFEAARGADVLITTAGASVGEHDLVKDVLEELGFVLDFWRVRMRPGSPFSFGRLGRLPVFGLAGNPVSALVTFEILVRPALRRMQGRTARHGATLAVRAAERIPGAKKLTHFPRVRLERDAGGEVRARLTGPQGSGILTSMTAADALAIVPEGVAAVEVGDRIMVLPLGGADPAVESLGIPAPAPAASDAR